MTQEERYETMRHCKWVDEVVIDSPWVIDEAFLNKVRGREGARGARGAFAGPAPLL